MQEVISIVACGPSALVCGAAEAPGWVLAVNDAYRHVRHDAILSMDGRWAMHRVPELQGPGAPLYLRRRAVGHVNPELIKTLQRNLVVFECDNHSPYFGKHQCQLNGQNSGYCAINLAYVLRPKRVFLFGFDHKGDHFHPESEWRQRGEGLRNTPEKFKVWSRDYKVARELFAERGIEVINTNRDSGIRAFDFGDAPCH